MVNFSFTEEEVQKLNEWLKTLPENIYSGAIGGLITYSFTPTGLGMIKKVYCNGWINFDWDTPGESFESEIDLTDYKDW